MAINTTAGGGAGNEIQFASGNTSITIYGLTDKVISRFINSTAYTVMLYLNKDDYISYYSVNTNSVTYYIYK